MMTDSKRGSVIFVLTGEVWERIYSCSSPMVSFPSWAKAFSYGHRKAALVFCWAIMASQDIRKNRKKDFVLMNCRKAFDYRNTSRLTQGEFTAQSRALVGGVLKNISLRRTAIKINR
jgi:hypothetical protein